MTFGAIDHVLVALTVLLDPWLAIWAYRRMTASLAAGDERARIRSYRRAVGLELSGAALVLVLWAARGIKPADVWKELIRREGQSGVAEKAARKRPW